MPVGVAAGPLERRRRARQRRRLLDRRRAHLGAQLAARSPAAPAARARGLPATTSAATDPWLSFSPNGRLHAIAIAFDNSTARNAILAAYLRRRRRDLEHAARCCASTIRGRSATTSTTRRRSPPTRSTRRSSTRPGSASSRRASTSRRKAYENAASFYSTAWFARSTNGGEYLGAGAVDLRRPRQAHSRPSATRSRCCPDGTLINGFNLIRAVTNRHGTRGYNVALVRSTDKGETWSREIIVDRLLVRRGAPTPTITGQRRPHRRHPARTGRWTGARTGHRGNVYVGLDGHAGSTTPTTTTSCSPARPTAA